MPFWGVLPRRKHLFAPEPKSDIGVNDAHAWRLNPEYRNIYNKLFIAQAQGLIAAPCGVDPITMGLTINDNVFLKPITNLAGMSLGAGIYSVNTLPNIPGSFWAEYLTGQQSSTDCLVLNGEVVWFAHTLAANEKNKQRPVYWHIGIDLPAVEPVIKHFVQQHLNAYTGICNLEIIGDHIIEVHLRGSNAFYDFYGNDFISAWIALVDQHNWQHLSPVKEGFVYSVFGEQCLPSEAKSIAASFGVNLQEDHIVKDRMAICYAEKLTSIEQCLNHILG
jgi:hypothetical protein